MLPQMPPVNDSVDSKAPEEKRNEIFNKIAVALETSTVKPISDTVVTKIISKFTISLQESNKDLLQTLIDEDKILLKQTIDAIGKLQGKNSKELDRLLLLAEKLILSGQTNKNEKMQDIGEQLRETVKQGMKDSAKDSKGRPILTGDQDTIKNRFIRSMTGITPEQASVQGTSVLGHLTKTSSRAFREGMGSLFVSDKERNKGVEEISDQENKQVSLAQQSAAALFKILDSSGQPKANTNSPDNSATESNGEEVTTNLSNPASSIDTATRSDAQELAAGIRDTDPSFSRSSTMTSDPWDQRWKDLLDLMNKIKDCVCSCQCTGSGFPGLPLPVPVPIPSRTKTPVRTAAAESVVVTRSLPRTATAVEQLSLAKPIAKSNLLSSPKVATTEPLQLTQQRAGPTLEELGIKQTVKEKVPVRATAQPVYQSKELSVAERLRTGQISNAEEAKRIYLAERESGKTIGAAERTAVPGPKVEPEVAAARNRRPIENITTEEGRNNWRARRVAESSEDALLRRLQESGRTNNFTTGSPSSAMEPISTSRSLVPVTGTTGPTKPWYSRAWEGTKSAGSRAWEGTKSAGSRAWDATKRTVSGGWERAKGLGNKVTSGAERFGKWSANTRVGKAVVGATESRVGKGISSVASKVANSGAVKWGGRALGVLGTGLDIYNRKKQGQSNSKIATGVGGGLAAGYAGATAGAALGAFGGPAAPVTVPLGALIGGVGGYFAGSSLGDFVYDKITGKKKPVSEAKPGDKKPGTVAPATAPRQNLMARDGVMSPATISSMAPRVAPTAQKTAGLESGKNLDSTYIEKGTAATKDKIQINVPPPTVIQAPSKNAEGGQQMIAGGNRDRMNARPADSSWLRFQEKRAVA